jgi:hypothetical protein
MPEGYIPDGISTRKIAVRAGKASLGSGILAEFNCRGRLLDAFD